MGAVSIEKMNSIKQKGFEATAKDNAEFATLQIVNEMLARKIEVLPIDLHKSEAKMFKVEDGKITVVNSNAGNDGEFPIAAWSFTGDECTTYYMNSAIQKMQTWKQEWNKHMIIDYQDGVITLSLKEEAKLVNNPNLIRVYSIRVATQQEYDRIMKLLEE